MALTTTERKSVIRSLIKSILLIFPMLNPREIDNTWRVVLPLLENAIMNAYTMSAQLAAERYMTQRLRAVSLAPVVQLDRDILIQEQPSFFLAQPAIMDDPRREAVRQSLTVAGPVSIKKAMTRGLTIQEAAETALVNIQGVATRHALAGDRETTLQNVADDELALGWARIPARNACAFCMLLASRGGAYRTRESALFTSDRSARGAGQTYHDHCKCTIQGIWEEDWTPPVHVQQAQDMYEQASRSKDVKGAFAALVVDSRKNTQ